MRTFELSWPAKVRRSDGGPVRPGAACAIHGTVSTDGNRTNASADVVCGATTLYDWKDSPGSGLQMRSCTVSQTTDAEGDAYSLRCSDLGARTGRPQLSIDTALGTAAVWRDGGFRVDLSVRGPARHEGERISIESRVGMTVFGAIVRAGHVSRTFGEHTVRRGTACAVVVTTGEAPHPCRVNVQCGDRTLYGGGGSNGFASCDVVDGAPRRVTDENPSSRGGDPKLDLDLEARRVTISDEGPDWSVTIDLQ